MNTPTKTLPVLSLLFGLNQHFGKKYCYPSQLKLLGLLAERLSIEVSIATLNRHLRVIEDSGYLKRIRRIRRDPVVGMVFQSTIYVISRKGYKLLSRAGVMVYAFLRNLVKRSYPTRGSRSTRGGRVRRNGEAVPIGKVLELLKIPGVA